MNTDIRISVSFRNHRKRTKLRMILGDRSTDYLLDLWLSVAMDRPDGDLHGLDAMDIAIMAGWNSDPQVLVNALVEVGFLDATTVERSLNGVATTEYSLHDWCEHNGYASAANDRSGKSRFSRMAKTHPVLYKELKESGYDSITSEEFRKLTTVQRPLTNRSSPSPLPSPSPSIKTTAATAGKRTEELLLQVFKDKEARIRELFPQHNFEVVKEGCLAHYRDKPPTINPYETVIKWFQREQVSQPKLHSTYQRPKRGITDDFEKAFLGTGEKTELVVP